MDRLLPRIGEAVWVAALAALASLAVVTTLAAWGSAAAALRESEGDPGITGAWWAGFCIRLRGTLALAASVAALAVVAAADLAWALAVESGPVRFAVLGVGGAVAVTLLAVVPFLTVLETDAHCGNADRLRAATALAGVRPLHTAVLVFTGAGAVIGAVLLAPLAPVLFAVHLTVTNAVYRAARSALHRAARPH